MPLRPTLALVALAAFVGGLVCLAIDGMAAWRTGVDLGRFGAALVLVALHVTIVLGLLVARARGRTPRLMAAGVVIAIAAAILWVVVTWMPQTRRGVYPATRLIAVTASVWALLVMVIGIALCQTAVQRPQRIARGLTVATATLIMAALPTGIYVGVYLGYGREPIFRTVATAVVVLVASLLASLILGRLRETADVPEEDRPRIDLTCPRCRKPQRLATGGARCGRCGLVIRITAP